MSKKSSQTRRMSIHGPIHWDSILHEEFEDESDRACVILAAALLDSALETLLRELLVACSTSEDPLFDSPNAPPERVNDFETPSCMKLLSKGRECWLRWSPVLVD